MKAIEKLLNKLKSGAICICPSITFADLLVSDAFADVSDIIVP